MCLGRNFLITVMHFCIQLGSACWYNTKPLHSQLKGIHSVSQRKDTAKEESDSVAVSIRTDILKGVFKPGEKLKQVHLARHYGTSRAPIRDALIKLAGEGMVVFHNKRYAAVPRLDLNEFQEIYQIRRSIEALAVSLSAPKASDSQIKKLEEYISKMESISRSLGNARWLELDKAFHFTYYESCPNKRLLSLIEKYWNSTHYFRWVYCLAPAHIAQAQKMHRYMFEAIEKRDGEMAAVFVRKHVEDSINAVLESQLGRPGDVAPGSSQLVV